MPDKTFHCSVITPEASVLETDASFAALPAHDGEIGILHDRAPLLCKLGLGELRLDTADGKRAYFIDGGFAQVVRNSVIVLTSEAIARADLSADQAQKDLDRADALPATSPREKEKRDHDRARAKTILRLVVRKT